MSFENFALSEFSFPLNGIILAKISKFHNYLLTTSHHHQNISQNSYGLFLQLIKLMDSDLIFLVLPLI